MFNTFEDLNWRLIFYQRRELLGAIAAIVGAIVLVLLVIYPQVSSIFQLLGLVDEQQTVNQQLQQKANELESVQSSLLFSNQTKIDQALPSQKPLVEMLNSLNSAAQLANVSISQIQLSPGIISTDSAETSSTTTAHSGIAGVGALDVEMRVQGTFAQIQSFLELVDQMAPISTVTSLFLAKQDSDITFNPSQQFGAETTIRSYFFGKVVTARVTDPIPVLSTEDQLVLTKLDAITITPAERPQEILRGGLEDIFGTQVSPQQLDELEAQLETVILENEN